MKVRTDLPINTSINYGEALRFWIASLQAQIATGEIARTILVARGYADDYHNFTEVNLVDDDPCNITDGTWEAFQLWEEGQ